MHSEKFYKEKVKEFNETDFWKQVRRTINGVSVSDEQIQMIVEQIHKHLEIKSEHRLLDLCCGNGALSNRVFSLCHAGLGIDYSEYLIKIAKKYFEDGKHIFVESDVIEFVRNSNDTNFNIGLCYGSLQFLPPEKAEDLVSTLFTRFSLDKFFIGNIPDRNLSYNYFEKRGIKNFVLDDYSSPIGYWWEPDYLKLISENIGWGTEIFRMPDGYYNKDYRFDLLLTRT